MTLNLTLITPAGAWQCTDERLSDLSTTAPLAVRCPKQVQLACPDGSALIALAGVGQFRGVLLAEWMREILRGERRSVQRSLEFIRDAATADLGSTFASNGWRHMFSAAAFIEGSPWLVQIRNFDQHVNGALEYPVSQFKVSARQIHVGGWMMFGAYSSVSRTDRDLLTLVCSKRPRHIVDFHNLLAAINLRTSARDPGSTVSRQCVTAYMPADGKPIEARAHGNRLGEPMLIMPGLHDGFDSTATSRWLYENGLRMKRRLPPLPRPPGQAQEMVTPINRLRRS